MAEYASKYGLPLPEDVARAAQAPSNLLGKYVKVCRLGAGGMGEVWSGWDRELGRRVALKFLRHDDPEELERFRREAQTSAHLSHPNIASVYEVGQAAGKPFIVMQLVEGVSLAAIPKTDRRLLVQLLRDACLAVQYAHERHVIHRDLKPANFMVELERPATGSRETGTARRQASSARIYVVDFGLARQTSIDSSLSATGTALGTPAYMAPEQARGERLHVNEASDVYSLGATLYHPLSGGPPFQEKDLYQLLQSVVERDPAPLRTRNPDIDDELETIVMKCLEKDPTRRYESALALAEDLSRWLSGDSIQARQPTWTYRIRKSLLRHKGAVSAALGLLVLIAAALFVRSSVASTREVERQEHLEKAGGFVRKKEFQRALEHYSRALELGDAGDPEIRRRIADCQTQLDQIAGRVRAEAAARPAYEKGKLELDEAVLDLYRQGANLVRTRERLEAAIGELSLSIALWSGSTDALLARGRAHALRFEYDQAEQDFSKAVELNPRSQVARMQRGKLLLQRTIEAKMNMGWVWDASGSQTFENWKSKAREDLVDDAYVAFAEDRLADCIQACDQRLRENPTLEEVRKLQGDAFYLGAAAMFVSGKKVPEEKGITLAITAYTEALRLRPNYYEARMMRGSAYLKGDRRKEAREDLEAALRLRPDDSLACTFMAECEGSPKEAIVWLDRAVRSNPDSFFARINRARVLALLERNAEAREDLDRSTRLNPAHYYTWYLRGALRGRGGDMEGAYQDFKECTQRAKFNDSAWFNLGASAKNTGRLQEAVDAWEKALALQPHNRPEIERLVSETRRQLGR
jgi:tetratricopeptide (TPR) repeat protein